MEGRKDGWLVGWMRGSSIPLLSFDIIPRTRFDFIRAARPTGAIDLDATVLAFDLHRAGSSPFVGHVRTRVRTRALAVSAGHVGSLLALGGYHADTGGSWA